MMSRASRADIGGCSRRSPPSDDFRGREDFAAAPSAGTNVTSNLGWRDTD